MSKSFKDNMKRMKGIEREERIANGTNYNLSSRYMESRADKASDPKRQRKNKNWMRNEE